MYITGLIAGYVAMVGFLAGSPYLLGLPGVSGTTVAMFGVVFLHLKNRIPAIVLWSICTAIAAFALLWRNDLFTGAFHVGDLVPVVQLILTLLALMASILIDPAAVRAQREARQREAGQYSAVAAQHQAPAAGSGGTNVFAVLALVGGLTTALLGLIFGPIALYQIKRTGERGRGLAISGMVIGGAMILGVVVWVSYFMFQLYSVLKDQ